MLPSPQARAANARVLKNLAAQSQLSIRTEVMIYFPIGMGFQWGIVVAKFEAIPQSGEGGLPRTASSPAASQDFLLASGVLFFKAGSTIVAMLMVILDGATQP